MSTPPTNPGPDERLSAWLDGELSPEEQRELEAEFARDPALRADLDALESVVRLVREEAPTVAPPGFHQRVMARVADEAEAAPVGLVAWVSGWFRRWEAIALVGAAVAALLLVIPLGPGALDVPAPDAAPSPGAVRLPTPVPSSSLPTRSPPAGPGAASPSLDAAQRSIEVPPSQVVGRARVEAPPAPPDPRYAREVENGTNLAWEQGQAATVPAEPDAPPSGTAEPPAPAAAGSARYVVSSDDPTLKRRVLSLASRYGEVRDARGRTVETAERSGTEELVVTVSQAELPAFTRGLQGLGFDVGELPSDLLAGGDVQLRLVLEGGAAPQAAPPAGEAESTR